MAKEDRAKVKMTVIHFETESDNATLQENIRSIAHTVSRALVSPQRLLTTPAQGNAANGGTETDAIPQIDDLAATDTETSHHSLVLHYLRKKVQRGSTLRHRL